MASSATAMLAPCDEMNEHLLGFTTVYKDATEAFDTLSTIPVLQYLHVPKSMDILGEDLATIEEDVPGEQAANLLRLVHDLETRFRTSASNEIQIVSNITSYVQTLEPTLMMGKPGPDLADVLKLILQMNVDQSADNAASRKEDFKLFQETLKAIQNAATEADIRIERLSSKLATHSTDLAEGTLFEVIHEHLVKTMVFATDTTRARIQISSLFELPPKALEEENNIMYTNPEKEDAVSSSLEHFRMDLSDILQAVDTLLKSLKITSQLAQALAGMWSSVMTRVKGLENVPEPIDPSLAAEITTSWAASCITAETFVTSVTGVMEQKAQGLVVDGEQQEAPAPIASDPAMLTMLNLESEVDVRA